MFHQLGDVEAITEVDIVDRFRATLVEYNSGPFANYLPYTLQTGSILDGLDVLSLRLRHSRMMGGGFHCVTLDIRRKGTLERYFV